MSIARQLILVLAFSATACNVDAESLNSLELPSFDSFILEYGRTYTPGSKEYDMRRSIYERSAQKVLDHNSRPNRLWDVTINHLSDWTDTEFSRLRGLRLFRSGKEKRSTGEVGAHRSAQFLSQVKKTVLPETKSWSHLKALRKNHAPNQGGCGSCWAVATSEMMHANAELYGLDHTFSAQELINCVPNPHNCGGSGGCAGATVELGMNWIASMGLDTEEGTPYKGEDHHCKKLGKAVRHTDSGEKAPDSSQDLDSGDGSHVTYHSGDGSDVTYSNSKLADMVAVGLHEVHSGSPASSFHLTGWTRLAENEYEPLIRAIALTGPAGVSVAADSWGNYESGVYGGCSKDATIDHAVVLMGYGLDHGTGQGYWHIRNSWGERWGEGGNIRLLREEGRVHCGVDSQPTQGTGCDGGPVTVPVCGMCGILYDSVVPHFAGSQSD